MLSHKFVHIFFYYSRIQLILILKKLLEKCPTELSADLAGLVFPTTFLKLAKKNQKLTFKYLETIVTYKVQMNI